MNRVLCSTGAIVGRPNGRDITLLNTVKDVIECDGYEFLMYDTWYEKVDFIRNFMLSFGKPTPVFHVEKSIGELIGIGSEGDIKRALELFEINCSLARDLRAEKLVLHLWNGELSDRNIESNIAAYKYLHEISEAYGLMLTVENVVCGLEDPMKHFRTLELMYPEIKFTYDTKMASFHDQLELLYKDESAHLYPRIEHMHINDHGGAYRDFKALKTLHIGQGKIDFSKLFVFLRQIDYKGDFTAEATSFDASGKIDADALNRDLYKIKEYIYHNK